VLPGGKIAELDPNPKLYYIITIVLKKRFTAQGLCDNLQTCAGSKQIVLEI
jgi:hypothetical protein